ncbi:MAG: hypothetical protein ACOYNH_09690, partial [Bacteroidia bacterium]
MCLLCEFCDTAPTISIQGSGLIIRHQANSFSYFVKLCAFFVNFVIQLQLSIQVSGLIIRHQPNSFSYFVKLCAFFVNFV